MKKKKKIKISYVKLSILILISLAIITGLIYFFNQIFKPKVNYPNDTSKESKLLDDPFGLNINSGETPQEKIILPNKVINKAPFIPQAPNKIWDDLHNEACEEAAIISAHFYLQGKKKASIKEAEAEIQGLVSYQIKNYNSHHDLDAENIVKLVKDYYNENYELVTDYDLEKIKEFLAKGKVIIIPAAGRQLGNPNFKNPGPLYHALTIIGYDDKKKIFIVQDPGTRKGEEFKYSYDILLNAIHDYPGDKEKILEGRKAIIIASK